MKKEKNFLLFEILSTVFILILGTVLHFTFAFSNNNPIVGIFSAVNESTWEHLKLLFFPMLITIIIGFFVKNKSINYVCNKTKGLIIALSFIIVFFYTYTGVIGTNYAFLDISSFFIATLLGQIYAYIKNKSNCPCNISFLVILFLLLFSFIFFTFFTPHICLFKDTVTKLYGIN